MIQDTKSNKIFILSILILITFFLAYQHTVSSKETFEETLVATQIEVNTGITDINIWPDDQAQNITVEAAGAGVKAITIKREGTKGIIDFTKIPSQSKIFMQRPPVINITVPSSSLDDIQVKSTTGDIQFFGSLSVQNSLFVENNTGDIEVEVVKSSHTISLQTNTGDIVATNLAAPSVVAQIKTGDLEIKKINTQHVTAHTTTGDLIIDAFQNKNSQATLSTTTGDIDLELATEPQGMFHVTSNTGNLEINDTKRSLPYQSDKKADASLIVTTGTGDIEVNYPSSIQ